MSKKNKNKNTEKKVSDQAQMVGGDVAPQVVLEKDAPINSKGPDASKSDDFAIKSTVANDKKVENMFNKVKEQRSDTWNKPVNQGSSKKPNYNKKNKKFGKQREASSGSSTWSGEDKGVSTKSLDKGSNTSKTVKIGTVAALVEKRTITEIAEPKVEDYSLLGPANFTQAGEITLDNNINIAGRYVGKSQLIGMNDLAVKITENILNIKWSIQPYGVGAIEGDETAKVNIAFGKSNLRIYELNNPVVNVNKASTAIYGASAQGYPRTSFAYNEDISFPYSPNQIDKIKIAHIRGGAIIRKGNVLTPVYDNKGNKHYITPGIPGLNEYKDMNDVTNGVLSPVYRQASKLRDKLYIMDGAAFSSSNDHVLTFANNAITNGSNSSEIDFNNYNEVSWNETNSEGGITDSTDYGNYPDLNYGVLNNNAKKLWLAFLEKINSQTDQPWKGQLNGFRNEQAFLNAMESAIRLTTMFRIIIYAYGKTWKYGPFTKSKIGHLAYTDMYLRSMSYQARLSNLTFLTSIGDLIKDLPYDHSAVENFKVWFEASPLNKDLGLYAENNPIISNRIIFADLVDTMKDLKGGLFGSFSTRSDYFPRMYHAPATSTALSKLTKNLWGYNVKSINNETPIFVPHGDAWTNFIKYFEKELFYVRLTDTQADKASTLSADINSTLSFLSKRRSLTAILDPLNMTGWMAAFVSDSRYASAMRNWITAYVTLVSPFFNFVKDIVMEKGEEYNTSSYRFGPINSNIPTKDEIVYPSFKQHIVSSMLSASVLTPKFKFSTGKDTFISSVVNNVKTPVEFVSISSHLPWKLWSKSNDPVLSEGIPLPRVGVPLAKSEFNIDFGTKGDIFYNLPVGWAVRTKSTHSLMNTILSGIEDLDPYIEKAVTSSSLFPVSQVPEVRSLYTLFWYPSVWTWDYLPGKGIDIVPGYDYGFGSLLSNVQTTYSTFLSSRSNNSFSTYDPVAGDYVESFSVDKITSKSSGEQTVMSWAGSDPAVTSIRMTYGSSDISLIDLTQWTDLNLPSSRQKAILLSRVNAISIFTANNCEVAGIANKTDDLAKRDAVGVPFGIYTDKFLKSLGFTYLPFMGYGSGGAFTYEQVHQYVPFYYGKLLVSDLDVSIRYANLMDVLLKMQSGLYDGETYPSSDGYGNDLLAHPEKQRMH